MKLQMRTITTSIVLGVSALLVSGTASAASCVAMQKELGTMGNEIVQMQANRDEVVAIFEVHNNERAAANSELANLKTGMIKMSADEKAEYQASAAKHDEEAKAAQAKLESLNGSLVEKASVYNEKTAAFNKKCIG